MRHRITPEAVDAYCRGDRDALFFALKLKPWDQSPLDIDADPGDPADGAGPWEASAEKAWQLRQALEAAVAGGE
jgi:hypothetical protein